MTNSLKNSIMVVESAINNLAVVDLIYSDPAGSYDDLRAIIAAAKTTLPKTVKKWDVQASWGVEPIVKHGANGFILYPYEQKKNAIKFAAKLIELGWHNVSVVEVEVEE